MDLVELHGRRYDTVEQAPWTAYRKQTCTSSYGCVTSWRELYYDDAASLKLLQLLLTGGHGVDLHELGDLPLYPAPMAR